MELDENHHGDKKKECKALVKSKNEMKFHRKIRLFISLHWFCVCFVVVFFFLSVVYFRGFCFVYSHFSWIEFERHSNRNRNWYDLKINIHIHIKYRLALCVYMARIHRADALILTTLRRAHTECTPHKKKRVKLYTPIE